MTFALSDSGLLSSAENESRLERVLQKLEQVRQSGTGFIARCPVHEDRTPSLSIDEGQDGRILLKCHAGCSNADILQALKMDWNDLFSSQPAPRARSEAAPGKSYKAEEILAWPWTQAIYEYQDLIGKPLYLVVRLQAEGKKSFTQYRATHSGRWTKGLGSTTPVLYRLPELALARTTGATVYVVEGEKDVDTLRRLGFTATCNPGGAGKWRENFTQALKGCRIVILPDNDDPGKNHARLVAEALYPLTASLKVVELPGLARKGDVSEWVEQQNGTRFELERIVAETESYRPEKQPVESDSSFHLTDLGNAQRVVQAFGSELRYCHPWQRWLVWDGRRWAVDQTGEVARKAKAAVRRIYAEASQLEDDRRRQLTVEHAKRSESHARLKAMVAEAASEPGIPVLPDELDARPWAFNCLNGTVDLRTGQLSAHNPADNLTRIAPVEYNPTATCPVWESFLDRVMGGNQEMVSFLQRAVGYSLTSETSEHCLFFLYGTGRNGKSTFLECIYNLLGDYAQKADFSTFLEKKHDSIRNDLARLKGCRFLSASETTEGRKLAEALVKDVTGGETITARHLYGEYFDFRPTFKLFLSANHKPSIKGTDEGIWSRIRLLPFTVFVPSQDRDRHLANKLRREMSGILAWAVRGCLEWQKLGLAEPAEVEEATQKYRDEMDPLIGFFEQQCRLDDKASTPAKALFEAYQTWALSNGDSPMSQTAFGLRLNQKGLQRFRSRINGVLVWSWSGVTLEHAAL